MLCACTNDGRMNVHRELLSWFLGSRLVSCGRLSLEFLYINYFCHFFGCLFELFLINFKDSFTLFAWKWARLKSGVPTLKPLWRESICVSIRSPANDDAPHLRLTDARHTLRIRLTWVGSPSLRLLSQHYIIKTFPNLAVPPDTRCWINVDLTLVQRRRRWTNVKPTLIQRLVSAGVGLLPNTLKYRTLSSKHEALGQRWFTTTLAYQ